MTAVVAGLHKLADRPRVPAHQRHLPRVPPFIDGVLRAERRTIRRWPARFRSTELGHARNDRCPDAHPRGRPARSTAGSRPSAGYWMQYALPCPFLPHEAPMSGFCSGGAFSDSLADVSNYNGSARAGAARDAGDVERRSAPGGRGQRSGRCRFRRSRGRRQVLAMPNF